MQWLRRTLGRARDLWQRAKAERASPRQIGVAVAIGTMACFAPVVWLHLAAALVLASALRVNRLWAAAASQLPSLFGLLRPLILFAEIEIGRFVRTGAWLDLTPREAVREAPQLLLDWGVGAAVVCVVLAVAFGTAAWAWARRRDAVFGAGAEETTTPRRPDERLPPSSGSPR